MKVQIKNFEPRKCLQASSANEVEAKSYPTISTLWYISFGNIVNLLVETSLVSPLHRPYQCMNSERDTCSRHTITVSVLMYSSLAMVIGFRDVLRLVA